MTLDVAGYAESLKKMEPVGGEADFNCKNLVDLKFFLQGGDLLIHGNSLYFKVDADICPDEFAVAAAARMLLQPYSAFIKFNKKFDGALECNYKVLDDSVKAEYSKDLNAYMVTFDLLATIKAPLQQLPYYTMRRPFPIRATQKMYKILKNFVEIPENMDFVFADKKSDNSIAVKFLDSFQMDYMLLKNILHLESRNINVYEFGSLMATFYPDLEKRKTLGRFFVEWNDPSFPDVLRKVSSIRYFKLQSKPFPNTSYSVSISFRSFIRDKDFMQALEKSRQTFENMRANLKSSFTVEGYFRQYAQFLDNEFYVRAFCKFNGHDQEMKKKIRNYEHLTYLDEFFQVGIDAFDVLIGILKEKFPYLNSEDGKSYYSSIKYLIENVVCDAIKADPVSYLDFGRCDKKCEEIRNYAKLLISGGE